MKKRMETETLNQDIVMPEGARYLEANFKLPDGIVDKGTAGCGATTLALTDGCKTIVCSPRIKLIENKHEQHPDTLIVCAGVGEPEIRAYLATAETPKVLTTYDSMPKVARCIDDKSDWRVVVDEFQYLLSDSTFKSETEQRLLQILRPFEHVTYLSATPILDKYLSQMDDFKAVPRYRIHWPGREKTKVIRMRTNKPLTVAQEIVKSYQKGIYPKLSHDDGRVDTSNECVLFLNSVTNIVNIIKKTGLQADEVNIIVGNSEENDRLIAQLGEDYAVGHIPLRGEPHRKYTFCTSTAFAGCDFYSTCATTFVISDGKREHTVIDIATDLVQIAGRQRLEQNPFRGYLVFVYNQCVLEKTEDEFRAEQHEKLRLTQTEVEMDNAIADPALRQKRIRDVLRLQKMLKYNETYIMYDEQNDRFTFNHMAYLSECYAYDLQRYNYANAYVVRRQLDEQGFDTSTPVSYYYRDYEEQLESLIARESFAQRMERYCHYREDSPFDLSAALLEEKYPELRLFYETLGGERIKALGYKEAELQREVAWIDLRGRLSEEFKRLFCGKVLTAGQIRDEMNRVYNRFELKKKRGKVTDLSEVYGLHVRSTRPVTAGGKRERLYEISEEESRD